MSTRQASRSNLGTGLARRELTVGTGTGLARRELTVETGTGLGSEALPSRVRLAGILV